MTKETDNEAFVRGAQQVLVTRGFLPSGKIDGWAGEATRRAFSAMLLARLPVSTVAPVPPAAPRWPSQDDVIKFYGPAGGPDCIAGKVKSPVPFTLAWSPAAAVRVFSCHRKVETQMNAIFSEAVAHYGETRFVELRLNVFGGCYNVRKMRGGDRMSTHSWGIAVDLDPDRNQLSWGRGKAAFSRPEYEPFWKIVEAQGGVSLGRVKNFDWMHFQFATL